MLGCACLKIKSALEAYRGALDNRKILKGWLQDVYDPGSGHSVMWFAIRPPTRRSN